MAQQADLLPGTLDLLILKAVSLGPQHGYGVLLRIEQISAGALAIEQGALYPALYRLERRGLLKTEWGVSDNNRKAKFYELTTAGAKCLREETAGLEQAGDGYARRVKCTAWRGGGMSGIRMLLAGLFRRTRVESEMAQELRFHIDSRAADLERSGLSHAAAERRARVEFGGIEKYKESCREASGFHPIDELRADLRYTFRTMRHNLVFTVTAVLSLALGIGVNLSCFMSLYAMVLHPFNYPDLDRIMTLSETAAKATTERDPVSPANYLDWKRANRLFENLAAYRVWDVNLTGVNHPDHIRAAQSSAEFFQVLGIAPSRGRTFSAAECEPGRDAVAVISQAFWQARLGARPDVVGERVSLSGREYTVIGVMPDEFNLPLEAELWVPLAFTPQDANQRNAPSLEVIGKLKAGVGKAQARLEMDTIARQLEARYPRTNEERRVFVGAFTDVMKTETNQFMLVLTIAGLFVLVLACTNVGGLQVARILSREKEIGLRSALGASVPRILRQLLTESLVLGLASGAVGLALSVWDLHLMRAAIPAMVYRLVPGLKSMGLNDVTIGVAIGLSLAASVLCCLPAIFQVIRQAKAIDTNEVLKSGGRSVGAAPARTRMRSALVIAQVALAFVLLVGAGLMVSTFKRMLTVSLGYDHHHVLAGAIALSGNEYTKPSRIVGFCDQLTQSAMGLPGVQTAAVSGSMGEERSIWIERRAQPRAGEPRPALRAVTSQYMTALKLPLIDGRWISEQDGPTANPTVVLSASVVRHYWPSGTPIGQRVRIGNIDSPWLTVVGVAGDVNDWFFGNPQPTAYVSYRQFPQSTLEIMLRTERDSASIAGALRMVVQAVDREQPVYNVQTLDQRIFEETSGVSNAARMMSTYALIALVLSVTGIYSISSFFVAQRTREIGVRMSLGASRGSILKMVLAQSSTLTGSGLLLGLPLAILLTVGMSRALYNVVSLQSLTFVLVMAILGGAAALAGYIPALRAARVDPMIALRHE